MSDNDAQSPAARDPETNHALFSVYFHAAGLSPDRLPKALRPMALQDALEVIPRVSDRHRPLRAELVAHQMMRASGIDNETAVHRGVRPSAPPRWTDASVDAHLSSRLRVKRGVVTDVLDHARAHHASTERCTDPQVTSTANTAEGSTELYSKVKVLKPIGRELAERLDPRNWDRCRDLFAETHEVEDPSDGRVRNRHGGVALGHSWKGFLFERAEAGPQAVENVLRVDFVSEPAKLEVRYQLFRSLSYTFGGLEFPGIMQQNWGTLSVEPDATDPTTTSQLVCTKTVRYSRWGGWSAGGLVDFGEIFNYLAAATLPLWAEHLSRVVPCCA